MSTADAATPLMRQYHSLKQQVPQALLLFRLGDFYELFYEDAVTAARELQITLTSRSKEKDIPMCGVPYHAAENYIARLIKKGYRVAICEQTEDPKVAKKLVRREITRVVTPGTVTESNVLSARENNYLAAVLPERDRAGIAHVDISTGEFRVTEIAAAEITPLLESFSTREVLLPTGIQIAVPGLRTDQESWTFAADYGERSLREHFGVLSLDGLGLAAKPLAVRAAGAILHYLQETQRSALTHLAPPLWYERHETMVLDAVTVRNLELVEPLLTGERADSTLLSVIDQTQTGMGARLLRRRLLRPCLDEREIVERLNMVESLLRQTIVRASLRTTLSGILDIERLLAKVTLGSVTPREMLALGRSLAKIPVLLRTIAEAASPALGPLGERLDELADIRELILQQIADEPPASLNDGGTIRDGCHAELDELRDISRNSKSYLAQIELRERARTNIQSLKVRFNNVFGYYLEISKANLHLAPSDYERKQTLVNAERFTTPELKVLEAKILDAEDKILTIERELFTELRTAVAAAAVRLRATASAVAEVDVAASLAQVAAEQRYTRPQLVQSGGALTIRGGRHPVIEKLCAEEAARFIPNDIHLDPAAKFVGVITGPNMGGKSTYLRQAALIVILAQLGSFVPADEAVLPLVDRVFTRIGAADNLARGRSTFMVEMTETAVILNTATNRSLVILDEIGRGTSTYDGLALAWSVVEYLHEHIGACTLFATHYHELTEMEDLLPGVMNLQVLVKEAEDRIIFLRRVEPGRADRSYGIEVARLAALPRAVIERAREVLFRHERTERTVSESLAPTAGPLQIRLFEPVNGEIADRIRRLNVDQLRPIEALQILHDLQQDLQ